MNAIVATFLSMKPSKRRLIPVVSQSYCSFALSDCWRPSAWRRWASTSARGLYELNFAARGTRAE
jgi:hypothetical protein